MTIKHKVIAKPIVVLMALSAEGMIEEVSPLEVRTYECPEETKSELEAVGRRVERFLEAYPEGKGVVVSLGEASGIFKCPIKAMKYVERTV